jgi:sugar/nucleoside kinase (ribokinase family)
MPRGVSAGAAVKEGEEEEEEAAAAGRESGVGFEAVTPGAEGAEGVSGKEATK